MSFEQARRIADAVMYEGYALYPYRPSSVKNHYRWQFGIVAPRDWGTDPWEMQTECLVEYGDDPSAPPHLDVLVRFLQVQSDDTTVERAVSLHAVPVSELSAATLTTPLETPGDLPISGRLQLSAERVDGFFKLRIRIENHTPFPESVRAERSGAMRLSLIGTQTLLAVSQGAFVSLMDPPAAARAAAASCTNLHTWPVLVGSPRAKNIMLSSPIILEDYPAIAPESPGDLCDATEIDELLTLRVMTLTDDEKREASAWDNRVKEIIAQANSMPSETLQRLHGAFRSPGKNDSEIFFNPPDEAPDTVGIAIEGGSVSRGVRVRLAPKRHSDSMDLVLAGRTAMVEGVHHDVENRAYVAVRIEDDPAAEVHGLGGRFFYYFPDELELMEPVHQ